MTAAEVTSLSAGWPLKAMERSSSSPPRRPEDWLAIRSVILDVVKSRHLNDRATGTLADFDFDSFFAASDSLLDFGEIIWFTKTKKWPSELLEGYLWLVGTLQSLTVLRDATNQFSRCFGVKKIECADALFAEVNELRVAAIGHPSNHNRNSIHGATFLVRSMSGPGKFEIGTYPNNGKLFSREIDMPSLIERVERATTIYMRRCYNASVLSDLFDTSEWQCFDEAGIDK